MAATGDLEVRNGDMVVGIRPGLGGALTGATWRGVPLLRPTPPDATDPRDTACFPLVPFCNRIPGGRFQVGGRTVQLPLEVPGEPHALHGIGWRRPWRVAAQDTDHACLALDHTADPSWPWSFGAELRVTVGPDRLALDLTLVNRDGAAMPAGVGLHPYLRRSPGLRLTTALAGMWTPGPDLIPVARIPVPPHLDPAQGLEVASAEGLDACFDGWDGIVRLTGEPPLCLSGRATARYLHLYIPAERDFFCVEPVSHRPDPFADERTGLATLAPGEHLAIGLEIRVETGRAGATASDDRP